MDKDEYPKEFLEHLESITNRRARFVIDHIIEHGLVSTEDIKNAGYEHPPRAARDVREAGIPLETFKMKSTDGKSIAYYKFGDLSELAIDKKKGRVQFSKEFKRKLYVLSDGRCAVCHGIFEERYLQVDHRVPYEVGGDSINRIEADYMLLCGSCNRAKSWSCEHCPNWKNEKEPSICRKCYWGSPENYNHIALEAIRRLDVQWAGDDEVSHYDEIKLMAHEKGMELHEFVKELFKSNSERK